MGEPGVSAVVSIGNKRTAQVTVGDILSPVWLELFPPSSTLADGCLFVTKSLVAQTLTEVIHSYFLLSLCYMVNLRFEPKKFKSHSSCNPW